MRKHHDELHKGLLGDFLAVEKKLSKLAQSKVRSATHVGVVSSYIRKNWKFDETFGYETKFKRENLKLRKIHANDAVAVCLKDDEKVKDINYIFRKRLVSKGDYKQTAGSRSEKRMPTGKLFGLRKFDLVSTSKGTGFVKGKRSSGFFSISDIDGNSITDSVSVKHGVKRLSSRKVVISIMETMVVSNSSAQLKTDAVSLEEVL